MTSATTLRRIFNGMLADISDYRSLRQLLEAQFSAALRHRAQEINEVVSRILELTVALDRRRQERVELASTFLAGKVAPASVSLQALSEQLPLPTRKKFVDCCKTLEALVKECKRLNRRNCNLLTAQHDVMRRVLKTEVHIYAPA
jgi:flagellar biosynthesis protein FlgN